MSSDTPATNSNGFDDPATAPADVPDDSVTDQVRDQFAQQSEVLMQHGAELREQFRTTSQQLTTEGGRFVRENPGLALAGAMGMGVLIGLSVRGRY